MSKDKTLDIRSCHILPKVEIEKFFKKLSEKAYNIHIAMAKKSSSELREAFKYDSTIRARGYFHLHPRYDKYQWLLDHTEFSLPVFQFDTVKDYQSRKYFKDLIYYNGNLKSRHTTCFDAIGISPTIIFDITMIVKFCVIEDGLFREKKEVADVTMDHFNIIFEYKDEDAFVDFLKKKYHNWGTQEGFYTRRLDPTSFTTTYIASQRWDVLNDQDKVTGDMCCCFPVDCWKDMLWMSDRYLSNFIAHCLIYRGNSYRVIH